VTVVVQTAGWREVDDEVTEETTVEEVATGLDWERLAEPPADWGSAISAGYAKLATGWTMALCEPEEN